VETTKLRVGRPKGFDTAEVLQKAVDTFSARGYEGTSIQDLVDAMGINRYSLYEEFGGKHGLFVAALEHYQDRRRIRVAAHFAPEGSRMTLLRDYFQTIHNEARKGGACGCMIVNSAVELAREDREIAHIITEHFQKLEEIFLRQLTEAKIAGEINTDRDLAMVARFLLNVARGLRVMVTYERDQEVFEDILNLAFELLEPETIATREA